jgi:hypothetical protein
MRVFHRTTQSRANAILTEGFKDAEGKYLTDRVWGGVLRVSDRPLDVNEGACGDVLLELAIPSGVFDKYEWVEEGKPHRESLIPAAILSSCGRPALTKED